jgi:hypothetical protein
MDEDRSSGLDLFYDEIHASYYVEKPAFLGRALLFAALIMVFGGGCILL